MTNDKIYKAVMEAALAYYLEPYDQKAMDGIVGRISRLTEGSVTIDDSPKQIDTGEVRGTITLHPYDKREIWSYYIFPKAAGLFHGPIVQIEWIGD